MNINQIEIYNFRGFKGEQNIYFDSRLNVFLGINGAGKSSLLDLIAIFLNQFTAKLADNKIDFKINELDINIDEYQTINQIYIKILEKEIYNEQAFGTGISDISWLIQQKFRPELGYSKMETDRNKIIKDINTKFDTYISNYQKFLSGTLKQRIPIFKYFQTQRISEGVKNNPKPKRYLTEQLIAYNDAFNVGLNFNEFVTWFIEEENIENREKIKQKDFNYQNPNLKIIREAIETFFGKFTNDKYENFRVEDRTEMSKIAEKSSLVIDKNGKTYNLKQLSDGEKNLILIISDIASKLAIANPSEDNPIAGEGIVLIDEIDLHLHVAWQRKIIPFLLETFIGIQFFITTHSPQVLGSIDKKNVFEIKDFKISKLNAYTEGRDSNSILFDVFGEKKRDEKYHKEIELLYDFIDDDDKTNVKKQLDKLTSLWGDDDNEIIRANMYYDDLT